METTGKPRVVDVELKQKKMIILKRTIYTKSAHNESIPAAKFVRLHSQFDSSLEWQLHSVVHTAMEKCLSNELTQVSP